MEVKQGYKYTEEFGYIPEDWDVNSINDIANIATGGTPNTAISSFWNGTIKWMNSGELNLKRIVDVKGRITKLGLDNSSTKKIPAKSVLVGLAGQGKTRGTVAITYISLCTNQSIASILPSKFFVSEFLYQSLDKRYSELRMLSAGDGGRGGLNKQILLNLKILLPPIQEQEKIAQVLRDMDKLIESIEALLEKKRNLKIATMQKLLTPQPHWEERMIGDSICYEQPNKYIVTSPCYLDNGYLPVLTAGKTFILGYTNELNNVVEKLPVILFDDFTTDSRFIDFKFKIKSSATKLLYSQNEIIHLKFFFHYLVKNKSEITEHKRHWIDEFHEKEILVPSFQEQQKIAQILSNMDEEIDALEKELEKYRLLKTGTMQELLTGKTRLL